MNEIITNIEPTILEPLIFDKKGETEIKGLEQMVEYINRRKGLTSKIKDLEMGRDFQEEMVAKKSAVAAESGVTYRDNRSLDDISSFNYRITNFEKDIELLDKTNNNYTNVIKFGLYWFEGLIKAYEDSFLVNALQVKSPNIRMRLGSYNIQLTSPSEIYEWYKGSWAFNPISKLQMKVSKEGETTTVNSFEFKLNHHVLPDGISSDRIKGLTNPLKGLLIVVKEDRPRLFGVFSNIVLGMNEEVNKQQRQHNN